LTVYGRQFLALDVTVSRRGHLFVVVVLASLLEGSPLGILTVLCVFPAVQLRRFQGLFGTAVPGRGSSTMALVGRANRSVDICLTARNMSAGLGSAEQGGAPDLGSLADARGGGAPGPW
jgi:hypothetical protein